jgi:hypothetical protein
MKRFITLGPVNKAGAYLVDPLKGTPLRAFLPNIRLGWKWLVVTYCLAYNIKVLFTAVKRFIVQTPKLLASSP